MNSNKNTTETLLESGAVEHPKRSRVKGVFVHYGDSSFRALLWTIIAIFAGLVLLFVLSFPEKYAMTFAVAVIAAPIICMVRNKEKLLMGAFLFSLPVGMGLKIIERMESGNSAVSLLFQIYLSDIFLIFLIIIWCFDVFLKKDNSGYSIWQSKLAIPLLLWVGMGTVSLIPAIDRNAVCVEIVRMGRVFLTFFIVFHYIRGRKEIHFILHCLLLALFIQSLLMFAQYATNSLFVEFPGHSSGLDIVGQAQRPSGTMGHSSHFAKLSGLVLPIALAYILFATGLRSKLLFLSIWVCGSVALVLAISRSGLTTWLLSIVAFFLGIVFFRIVPKHRLVPVFITCIVWVTISAATLYSIGGQQLINRHMNDFGSAAIRIPMFKVAFNVIKAHPITGVGLKNYILVHQDYDDTDEHISVMLPDSPVHNLFLLYAAEIGIPGLLFFLWFIWELLRGGLRCARHINLPVDKAIYLGMAIGVISLLLQSVTGMGVTNHLIHLSVISILAACVAKQCLFLATTR